MQDPGWCKPGACPGRDLEVGMSCLALMNVGMDGGVRDLLSWERWGSAERGLSPSQGLSQPLGLVLGRTGNSCAASISPATTSDKGAGTKCPSGEVGWGRTTWLCSALFPARSCSLLEDARAVALRLESCSAALGKLRGKHRLSFPKPLEAVRKTHQTRR